MVAVRTESKINEEPNEEVNAITQLRNKGRRYHPDSNGVSKT